MRGFSVRRFCGAVALFFAGQVHAAGPLDGIYQYYDWEEWLTIHQTGNHVVVGKFWKSTNTSTWNLRNGQKYSGSYPGYWTLMSGDLAASNSTSVIIQGESQGGGCISTYRIDFGAPQIWMEWVAESQTPGGTQQGIDCVGNYLLSTNNGTTTYWKLFKIF